MLEEENSKTDKVVMVRYHINQERGMIVTRILRKSIHGWDRHNKQHIRIELEQIRMVEGEYCLKRRKYLTVTVILKEP